MSNFPPQQPEHLNTGKTAEPPVNPDVGIHFLSAEIPVEAGISYPAEAAQQAIVFQDNVLQDESSDAPAQPAKIFPQVLFLAILGAGISVAVFFFVFQSKPIAVSKKSLSQFESQSIKNVVLAIDKEFESFWKEKGLSPAEIAPWHLQVRRIGLALCGTPPSLEHLRWLETLDEDQRVARYTSHLLNSKACADYLAERLARPWLGTHDGALIVYRGRRFRFWLSRQLQANKPYNQIVHQMVTATGSWNQNPAVNFYTAQCDQNQDNKIDKVRITGRISRNFMAMRLDCLQCHDDFMGTTRVGPEEDGLEGTQIDFHHIAAFFSKTNVNLLGVQEPETGNEYLYQLLDQEKPEKIDPKFPFPVEHLEDSKEEWESENPKGRAKKKKPTRRQQFASWLTSSNNRPFARAMVNRTWGLLFGRPLHGPVDDIPLYGPFPPAMEKLTDQFIDSGFDFHQLICLIVQTKPFRLRSDTDFPSDSEMEESFDETWDRFPLTKIRPEQMCGSIYQSAVFNRIDETSSTLTQLIRFGEQNDFIKRFGDLGDQEFGQSNQTVSQRLLLFNGKMIQTRLGAVDSPFSSYQSVATLAKDRPTLIETIFLLVLTRKPSTMEMEYFKNSLPENASLAAEDLAWVLTNCNESLWNH